MFTITTNMRTRRNPAEQAAKPDVSGAVKTLNEATGDYRAAYVARVEEMRLSNLKHMRETLAANGMDLNKVAPCPSSWSMSRKQYRMAEALHKHYRTSFEDAGTPISHTGRMNGKLPWPVKERAEAEPNVREAARRDANACFDEFLYKMAVKIGKSIKQGKLTGILWDGCTLTVECEDGETQVWNTKIIINQSVYGKLFNQWPSRRQS